MCENFYLNNDNFIIFNLVNYYTIYFRYKIIIIMVDWYYYYIDYYLYHYYNMLIKNYFNLNYYCFSARGPYIFIIRNCYFMKFILDLIIDFKWLLHF